LGLAWHCSEWSDDGWRLVKKNKNGGNGGKAFEFLILSSVGVGA